MIYCQLRPEAELPLGKPLRLGQVARLIAPEGSEDIPLPKGVVSMLTAALPDTHIDSTHYSTLGGWREHPRYNVILQMFAGTEYIPFDAAQ